LRNVKYFHASVSIDHVALESVEANKVPLERSMAKITGSVKSLQSTQIIVIKNIRPIAIMSTLIVNQPVTPARIYEARILSLSNLWNP
jgi:hypothetical protein